MNNENWNFGNSISKIVSKISLYLDAFKYTLRQYSYKFDSDVHIAFNNHSIIWQTLWRYRNFVSDIILGTWPSQLHIKELNRKCWLTTEHVDHHKFLSQTSFGLILKVFFNFLGFLTVFLRNDECPTKMAWKILHGLGIINILRPIGQLVDRWGPFASGN